MVSGPAPPSPAGATSTTPLLSASVTAARSAGLPPVTAEVPPCAAALSAATAAGSSGRSMTWAPCRTAYRMPRAMAIGSAATVVALVSSGSLFSRVTRTERIFASGATPMMPSACPVPCPCPAIRLATAVPLTPQNGPPAARPDPVKSRPVITEPARSGWVVSTPVLSTATVTPVPLVDSQACVTCSELSHHSLLRTVSARAGPAAATATQDAARPAAMVLAAPARRRCVILQPFHQTPGHSATFRVLGEAGAKATQVGSRAQARAQAGSAADSRTCAPGGRPSCSAASPPFTASEISPALSV